MASGAQRLIGRVMLGQYELVDVLGQGGMSVVFKGRHQLTNQEVALKILPPELAAQSQVKSRFLEEAKALAALDHPNIVHLYNFGQDDGYFVLAMQFVDGRTWEQLILEAGRLDWVTSCRIAIDVLRALEYAHSRGVVHRDMKPSNVLIRARDRVATVMDFGIAKSTSSTRLTATGQTMGTVRYMSPEQVRGEEVDLRTDLYSLGATLYESLIGDTPFGGTTHFEIMTRHLSDAPRRPTKLGGEMPAAVEDAVMRCLAKRPEDRFETARELRKDLEAVLREADIGLVETQKLERGDLAAPAPAAPAARPVERGPEREYGRGPSIAGPLADELEPGTTGGEIPSARRLAARGGGQRWLLPALGAAGVVALGGGGAAALLARRAARFESSVEIAGVSLTHGATAGNLVVETDGSVVPDDLARLYTSTLDQLRHYVDSHPLRAGKRTQIPDPIDVLLAVPATTLCEPTAYLDRQPPRDCRTASWAIAIGAHGTHRLMVVSDGAQLVDAVHRGAARAACEFSPLEGDALRELCDVTARFPGSAN